MKANKTIPAILAMTLLSLTGTQAQQAQAPPTGLPQGPQTPGAPNTFGVPETPGFPTGVTGDPAGQIQIPDGILFVNRGAGKFSINMSERDEKFINETKKKSEMEAQGAPDFEQAPDFYEPGGAAENDGGQPFPFKGMKQESQSQAPQKTEIPEINGNPRPVDSPPTGGEAQKINLRGIKIPDKIRNNPITELESANPRSQNPSGILQEDVTQPEIKAVKPVETPSPVPAKTEGKTSNLEDLETP